MMNKERLLEVADAIEQHKRFNMSTFSSSTIDDLLHTCYTVGCVAGWACALYVPHAPQGDAEYQATKFLELTKKQADRLFFAGPNSVWVDSAEKYGWETDAFNGVTKWDSITAEQAADVLRRIVNGELEL